MSVALRLGYVPLLDAAPLIVAEAMGFAEEEGLHFDLHAAPSWASLRDMLALGQVEAAHMLAPLPVAMALGLGRSPARFEALSVLNLNGNVIGVSLDLAARMRAAGHGFDFADAYTAGAAGGGQNAADRRAVRVFDAPRIAAILAGGLGCRGGFAGHPHRAAALDGAGAGGGRD